VFSVNEGVKSRSTRGSHVMLASWQTGSAVSPVQGVRYPEKEFLNCSGGAIKQ